MNDRIVLMYKKVFYKQETPDINMLVYVIQNYNEIREKEIPSGLWVLKEVEYTGRGFINYLKWCLNNLFSPNTLNAPKKIEGELVYYEENKIEVKSKDLIYKFKFLKNLGPPGIEPGSLPRQGSVLPLDYGPNLI